MRVAFLAGHLSHRASGVRQIIEGLSGGPLRRAGGDLKVFGIRDAAWTAGDDVQWQGAPPAEVFDRIGPGNFGYMPKLGGPALRDFAPDVVHLHGDLDVFLACGGAVGQYPGAHPCHLSAWHVGPGRLDLFPTA